MTTAELQAPTGYQGIYRAWNVDLDNADNDSDTTTGRDDFWDFGPADRYPLLKVDFNADGIATWQEFGNQMNDQPPAVTPAPTPTPAPTLPATPGADSDANPAGIRRIRRSQQRRQPRLADCAATVLWPVGATTRNGKRRPRKAAVSPPSAAGTRILADYGRDGAIVCWGSLSGIFTGTE